MEQAELSAVGLTSTLRLPRELSLARSESTRQTVLCMDTIDTMDGVEVLDTGNLEARRGTLAGSDR